MKLKRQLFSTFLMVAIIPLFLVSIYLFGTNAKLAVDLHEQNLQTLTRIQEDFVEEYINRLLVRAGRFVNSHAVIEVCDTDYGEYLLRNPDLANEIIKFTDETLDSVSMFTLISNDGNILYSSGSNSDTSALGKELNSIKWEDTQRVCEMSLGNAINSLVILTPVMKGDERVGGFLVAFRTDYFLKTISGVRQLETSNTLIYCNTHQNTVVSRVECKENLVNLSEKAMEQESGSLICRMGGKQVLAAFRRIPKTPWILVNSIPILTVLSLSFNYILISIPIILFVLLVILYLSGRQSGRILEPLERLLNAVEQFFVSGAEEFAAPEIDSKTEIGYLAEKFTGMSDEIIFGQRRLRESNYLYNALLSATYEFRITIHIKNGTILCSLNRVEERLKRIEGDCASQRLFRFLTEEELPDDPNYGLLARDIAYGNIMEPVETEFCCTSGGGSSVLWYRLIAVPIGGAGDSVEQVVLHFENITDKKWKEFRLIRTSQTDPLCNLLNRRTFLALSQMAKPANGAAVFFIDLDQFKQVNDIFGHAAGDEMLIHAAQMLKAQFRNTDLIGRYGGDEFVVFALNLSREQAEHKAKQLIRNLYFERMDSQGRTLAVTASVGVCVLAGEIDVEQAIRAADKAMYEAKQSGKSRYKFV